MRTVLLGLLMSFALIAQSAEGDSSLSGTVLNSVTGEPVKGALVMLVGYPQTDAAKGFRGGLTVKTATTGVGGEYLFGGLSSGEYTVRAQKPGFAGYAGLPRSPRSHPNGSPDSVDLSASVSGHTIRLDPLGVIEGKITNQYGDRLGRVSVGLFEYRIQDGVRYAKASRTVVTDDRGQYRTWDLQPGTYYVKAMGRYGATSMYAGDGSVFYDSWEGSRPMYFGGAREMDSATPIVVAAGTQERADFTLTVEPTYKVRGTLQSFTPGHFVTFELFESDPNVAAGRVSLNGGSGKFEIDDVPSGRYTLRATQGELARGETAVEVKGADANGVSIALSPGVTVTGVVHLLGATPGSQPNESAGNRWANARFGLGFCVVRLEVPGREPDGHLVAQMEASHQFSVPNVFWGQYRVRMECPGGHIVSALSGNSDLLSNPEISLQPGVAPPSIEIGLKPGGAELHGKLAVHDAPAGTGVLLVPTFAASMGPIALQAFGAGNPDELRFNFSNLAPGDYLAYAFSDIQSVEYRNPAFLQALRGGTTVRVEDGKTAEVTLTSLVQ